MEGNYGAGKGDRYRDRDINYQQWSDNWDAIFKPKKKKKVSDNNGSKDNLSKDGRATSKRNGSGGKRSAS